MAIVQCSACHGKRGHRIKVKEWGGGTRMRQVRCPKCKGRGHVHGDRLRW